MSSEWAARRFWTEVSVVNEDGGGWGIRLDDRVLRTPLKSQLVLPTRVMADAMAQEWRAQEGTVAPLTMPVTRAANSAVDKVRPQHAEVVRELAGYGSTDLLCYRAERPEALVERQAQGWDPVLDWAARRFDAPLAVTGGVMPATQPAESLARLAAPVAGLDEWQLTGFHDLVTLSGSLVLALAVIERKIPAETAWELSRIDEDYQAEVWGHDEEADEVAALKRDAFLAADRFHAMARDVAER